MTAPGIRDLLVRAVLEPAFRARVQAGETAALTEYALSAAERAAVLGGGPDVMALLGALLDDAAPVGRAPAPEEPGPASELPPGPPVPAETEGPPVHLLVRVMTGAERGPGAETRLHYAAVLQPVPDGGDARTVDPPEGTCDALPGERLTDARLEIVVVPQISRGADGALAIRYDCTARMLDRPAAAEPALTSPPAPPDLAAHTAAIRAAPAPARLPMLLDLLARMEGAADG